MYNVVYNKHMSKQKYLKKEKPYRPFLGAPYRRVFMLIAQELNKTSLSEFDDLDAGRHAAYELWNRVFPDKPFPPDADILRRRYYKDPEIVQSA